MKTNLVAYLVALLVFCIQDAIWLGLFAPAFYQGQIGDLLLTTPRLGAAALFYLMYLAGVVLFVVRPALEKRSLSRAVVLGALFGIVCYASYNLTNLATLKGWSVEVVVVDITLGAIETALASAASFIACDRPALRGA
jgi:uncharacterized membrane protein